MRGTTHLLFGVLLAVVLLTVYSYDSPVLAMLLIMLGSLLPDVDESSSRLGRKVPLVGALFKHRTFFHSIFLAVVAMILLSLIADPIYAWTLGAAILGHLILDGLTPAGVRPFWPSRLRIRGFVRVGSILEWVIAVALAVLIAILLLY